MTDFACAYKFSGLIEPLNITYDNSSKVLRLTTFKFEAPLKFSEISNIFYGSASKTDINIC